MKSLKFVSVLVSLALMATTVQAQESGTLKKIKDTGTITLGVRDSSIPFSFLDDKQNYQGYSIDLCLKAVTSIQKHLGLTSLNVKLNPVTSATRIPLMANGTIDLECGSTSNNMERQKQVSFAPTTFVTATRIVSKKTSHIKGLADLKGKTVVCTAGGAAHKQLSSLNLEQGLGITIVAGKDISESFLMVETGRAVAFLMDDILLASLVANTKSPADYEISKEALSVEPYGIMMRKDDPAFKAVVDKAISTVLSSGDINRIYNKWFLQAIPPKGISLNWPMSEQFKAVLAKPTDSGEPSTYAAVPEAQKILLKKKI
ncbi:amino acid ABC transporter substrate-binding protein [Undibacterium parvum]|uniref:Amino acid ABC transporter substrate-binding protein n=2 Tax=Undibacterium TaxID=401469 RepID=A0A6M4A860_9BURK|nr:amino acid ABC transporter substrate-binding protein [Undibacterium parvum]AZP12516.1 amino acid ABC transporter substrate-binding protein [Undibacterium parvum]QJQ06737.1 amino acid ABC transporter substrate-binding protein [Undibacterium piscinae]